MCYLTLADLTRAIAECYCCRGRTALELAANGTVRAIIERVEQECGGRNQTVAERMKKFKKGISKARILGMNVGGNALRSIQMQHKRYGRVRTTRAKHLDLDGDGMIDDEAVFEHHDAVIAGPQVSEGLGLSDLGLDLGLPDDDFFRR